MLAVRAEEMRGVFFETDYTRFLVQISARANCGFFYAQVNDLTSYMHARV
jgi:hypothetical protein